MNRENKTIDFAKFNNLCIGCGICEYVCPTDAISFSKSKGLNFPLIDNNKCINSKGCNKCYIVCPGVEVRFKNIAATVFKDSVIKDHEIGNYLKCFTGYSNNYEIRYHSASGGILSEFLIFLLENNYIDGAVVTAFEPTDEFLLTSYIAKTREDIIRARSTKYAPVIFNKVIDDLKKDSGTRFVIIGIPCHIHAFRKYELMDKKFKNKITGYFGLYC